MTRLFVRHKVQDYGAWRKAYDEFDPQRRSMGVTGQAVYRSIEDPNDITVSHDFDNPGEAKEFASSDKLREAIQKSGVIGEPEIWFVSKA
jgi:hypothetical protein